MRPSSADEPPVPSPPEPPAAADTGTPPAATSAEQPASNNGSSAGKTGERRTSPRRKKMLRVLLIDPQENTEPFPGWVVDRSLGGLCLSVDHSIDVGAILQVRPSNAPDGTPWVEVRVQSLRPKETTFELGCAFIRTPSWNTLLLFG